VSAGTGAVWQKPTRGIPVLNPTLLCPIYLRLISPSTTRTHSLNHLRTAGSSGYFWEVAYAATAAAAGRLSAPATTGAVPWACVAVVWHQSLSLCRREPCTSRAIYRQQLLSASALPAATVTIAVAVPTNGNSQLTAIAEPSTPPATSVPTTPAALTLKQRHITAIEPTLQNIIAMT
jgi:hypothetical protein